MDGGGGGVVMQGEKIVFSSPPLLPQGSYDLVTQEGT